MRARAHVRALMTQKSCAVEMRNAILRNYLKCFFKGDRGGRVDDFGTQGVVKFKPLVKNGKLFDVSLTERQTI